MSRFFFILKIRKTVLLFLAGPMFCSGQVIGLMPYAIADKYDIEVSRKVVYASSWSGWFASAYRDTILLNINNSSYGYYATDTTKFKDRVKKIVLALKPELVAIENEELLHGDIKIYCSELKSVVSLLPGKVTNGGLTLPELSYWYWNETHDTDFFKYNIIQKDSLVAGKKQQTIDNVAYELTVLKGLKMPYVNIHYYLGWDYQVPGLIRMFKYVAEYTGKPVISNEAGIYRSGLLPLVVDVARQSGMKYLILYSGLGTEGSGRALPISKTDYLNIAR